MRNAVVVETTTLVDKPKKFVRELVRMPDGNQIEWYYLDTPLSVMIVPVTVEGNLVFVRQYRHNLKAYTIELPAGTVDGSESVEQAALRELREETGYTATRTSSVDTLGSLFSLPSETNRYVTFVLVTDVVLADESEPSGDDQIECYFDMRSMVMSSERAFSEIGKDIAGVETAMALMLAKEKLAV